MTGDSLFEWCDPNPPIRPADGEGAEGVHAVYHGARTLTAGSLARFAIEIVSERTLPAGTVLGLARRWPSDWGTPQSDRLAALDYTRVHTSANTAVRWWHGRQHKWHPFDHVMFVELVQALAAGERLAIGFGHPHGGSPGFQVQTFIEEGSPLSIRLSDGNGAPGPELARPTVRIVGGRATRLVLNAPSRVAQGLPFSLHLRAEDYWGNPATDRPRARIGAPLDRVIEFPPEGFVRVDCRVDAPGIVRIAGHLESTPEAVEHANPIEVSPDAVDQPVFWGDLHAQSVIGCGARTIAAYHAHARDFAGTDVSSHQANCFLVTGPEWEETIAQTARFDQPGRFTTLLGVEWSAATARGGDHNLFFAGAEAELRRCSHEFVPDLSDLDTDLPHVTDLHRHYLGTPTVIALHVGGRTASLEWYEPTLDRLLEVHSTHATSEWFLLDALRRGYRMGVMAGSDSVDGRPGCSYPGRMGVRNVRGGLTAILASSNTRTDILDALRRRHCYGTTGERILLSVRCGDAIMGDEVRAAGPVELAVEVAGTAGIEAVDLFRDDQLLHSVDLLDPGELSNRYRIDWQGASHPGNWQRARMHWDGSLRIEPPARIVAVGPWAFDTPAEGIMAHDASEVAFRSVTAGNRNGVIVEVDEPAGASLAFATEPLAFTAPLPVDGTEWSIAAQHPERVVRVRRLPRAAPPQIWRGVLTDPAPASAAHAYWVRVRQLDGAIAWSSPIFVDVG
ncbi:MAG: DUF3604 domain-containing protein [Ectothiorhodospiraceae bacterium]|nr:DUF3604 domain-containing protein [Ectothiorhodospiraceae bacterium]